MTQVFKLHALFYLYSFDYKLKEAMDLPDLAVEALALTIRHLKGFGFEIILCSGALRPFVSNTEMTLSANTLQQLEVIISRTFISQEWLARTKHNFKKIK
jgi:hypothetical protein